MRAMAIKTFDTLAELSKRYNSPVFRDTENDSLIVQDVIHNVWHRYAWTQGKREIKYRETLRGEELPIMVQVYP